MNIQNDIQIVYLGTEYNEKSCRGLHEILDAGYKVKLAVAYVIPSAEQKCLMKRMINPLFYYRAFVKILKMFLSIDDVFYSMEYLSLKYNFPLIRTSDTTLTSIHPILNEINYDVLLSNGWMFKISKEIIYTAKLEALNCHSSYLPEYRGGNITYAPIINNEITTGVTVHLIEERFDSGKILDQQRIHLKGRITPTTMNSARAKITGKVLIEALKIVGHKEIYIVNPPSPFYFRCSYKTYIEYIIKNRIRKLFRMKTLKYEPQKRCDI